MKLIYIKILYCQTIPALSIRRCLPTTHKNHDQNSCLSVLSYNLVCFQQICIVTIMPVFGLFSQHFEVFWIDI